LQGSAKGLYVISLKNGCLCDGIYAGEIVSYRAVFSVHQEIVGNPSNAYSATE
jgi:hypothetical protein